MKKAITVLEAIKTAVEKGTAVLPSGTYQDICEALAQLQPAKYRIVTFPGRGHAVQKFENGTADDLAGHRQGRHG